MSGSEVGRHRLNSVRNNQMVLGGCNVWHSRQHSDPRWVPQPVSLAIPVGGGWETVQWCYSCISFEHYYIIIRWAEMRLLAVEPKQCSLLRKKHPDSGARQAFHGGSVSNALLSAFSFADAFHSLVT